MKPFRNLFAAAAIALAAFIATPVAADYNELLGTEQAGAAGETARIRVGRSLGRFYGLLIKAENAAPAIGRIVVHYQDGGHEVVENPDLGKELSIVFPGGPRGIDRVEITYAEGPIGADYRVLGIKTRPHGD